MNFFQNLWNTLKEPFTRHFWKGIKRDVVPDLKAQAQDIRNNIVGGVQKGITDFGTAIVKPFGDILFEMGDRQRAYEKAERELEYQRSLPVTQMQNLTEAGLNPNLVYSSGAAGAAGNYTPNEGGQGVQTAQALMSFLDMISGGLGSVMNVLGTTQNIKASMAGIDKTREVTRELKLKNDYQEAVNTILGVNGVLNPDTLREGFSTLLNENLLNDSRAKHYKTSLLFNELDLSNLLQGKYNSKYNDDDGNALNIPFEKAVQELRNLTAQYFNTEASTGYFNNQGEYISTQNKRLSDKFDENTLVIIQATLQVLGSLLGAIK